MKACIKCRKTEDDAELGSLKIVETGKVVGLIYSCAECQPKLKLSLMDIFLNQEKEGQLMH